MNIDVIVGVAGTVAAVAVSQWPRLVSLVKPPARPVKGVSYSQAIEALAVVRGRLLATGGIPEAAQKAIEALTLALVAGSDK